MLKINGKVTELKLKRILKYIKKDNKDNLTIIEIYGVDGAGKTFLVSDGKDLSTSELINFIASSMGRKARLFPVPLFLLKFFNKEGYRL